MTTVEYCTKKEIQKRYVAVSVDICPRQNPMRLDMITPWDTPGFIWYVKDVPGGFPKSDLLGVTVALIHVAAQR